MGAENAGVKNVARMMATIAVECLVEYIFFIGSCPKFWDKKGVIREEQDGNWVESRKILLGFNKIGKPDSMQCKQDNYSPTSGNEESARRDSNERKELLSWFFRTCFGILLYQNFHLSVMIISNNHWGAIGGLKIASETTSLTRNTTRHGKKHCKTGTWNLFGPRVIEDEHGSTQTARCVEE